MEIKNEGVDAFKPQIYGDTIILERMISDSTSLMHGQFQGLKTQLERLVKKVRLKTN